MPSIYRVGILGYQSNTLETYFTNKYGVEVFDLTVDQICSLLENPDPHQSVQATRTDFPAPIIKYEVMGGGRFFPEVSREELSRAVADIEILIARMNSGDYWNHFGFSFFESLLGENLAANCTLVLARVVTPKETNARGSTRDQKTSDCLKSQGLDIQKFKYKGKFFVITDKSRAKSKGKKVTKSGSKVNIERVRIELASRELQAAVTQPVKETVTAGKAIIGLGARLGRWFSSFVHAQ